MKDRSFTDSLVGAIVALSVLGLYALACDKEAAEVERRRREIERWALPRRRRRRCGPEDACTHCAGSGFCDRCAPVPCRVCRGRGLVIRDDSLVPRLVAMWGTPA